MSGFFPLLPTVSPFASRMSHQLLAGIQTVQSPGKPPQPTSHLFVPRNSKLNTRELFCLCCFSNSLIFYTNNFLYLLWLF